MTAVRVTLLYCILNIYHSAVNRKQMTPKKAPQIFVGLFFAGATITAAFPDIVLRAPQNGRFVLSFLQ